MLPDRKPDFECGVLKIWVLSRQFPNAEDYWDGNWLNIIANCSAAGASVTAQGAILHRADASTFLGQLKLLNKKLEGKAEMPCLEPNLSLLLECDEMGHIAGQCTITPDHSMQTHVFNFSTDQSYLKYYINDCENILKIMKDLKRKK